MSDEPYCVLIIDDDQDIRETFRDALDLLGYSNRVAANGLEGLTLLRESTHLPQVIFLDLTMPIMNGQQFIEQIAKDPRLASLPTILISADGNIPKKAVAIGVKEFLKKPLDLSDLQRLAQKHCGAPKN